MPPDATVTGLLVALGAGLLIGLERERRKGRGPGRGAAGIRTFALASAAGALDAASRIDDRMAAGAAMAAIVANSFTRVAVAFTSGGRACGLRLTAVLAASLAVAWAAGWAC